MMIPKIFDAISIPFLRQKLLIFSTPSSRLRRSDVRGGSAFPQVRHVLRAAPACEHESVPPAVAGGEYSHYSHPLPQVVLTQLTYLLFAITVLCTTFLTSCTKPSAPSEPASTFFKVDAKTAGTITGKIIASGKKSSKKIVNMEADPQCVKLHPTSLSDESLSVNSDGALANVFVYIKSGLEGKNFEPPSTSVVIDQNGCWFNPRILGIQVGQTLQVKNSDPVTHNIHPLPEINREWNQSQAPDTEPFTRKFSQPEVMIKVKCNIHAWMHAWVGAVAHPYFAVTKADGTFQLRDVPPGNYTIEIWHEELGNQEQKITLAPSGQSELNFNFN